PQRNVGRRPRGVAGFGTGGSSCRTRNVETIAMISAVFDCMVYLQAAISDRGPAFECVSLAERAQIELLLSEPVLVEVRDVLSRPKIRSKFAHLTDERVDLFLKKVSQLAKLIDDVPLVFSLPRDPKDEPYLNLAVAGRAKYLVSRDKDILSL